VYSEEILGEVWRLKVDSTKSKDMLTSLQAKFPGLTNSEIAMIYELVPGPEMRTRNHVWHQAFIAVAAFGATTSCFNIAALLPLSELRSAVVPFLFNIVSLAIRLYWLHRINLYRREVSLAFLCVGLSVREVIHYDGTATDIVLLCVAAFVALEWHRRMFPKLTWSGVLR
jgi:hypothetical protein